MYNINQKGAVKLPNAPGLENLTPLPEYGDTVTEILTRPLWAIYEPLTAIPTLGRRDNEPKFEDLTLAEKARIYKRLTDANMRYIPWKGQEAELEAAYEELPVNVMSRNEFFAKAILAYRKSGFMQEYYNPTYATPLCYEPINVLVGMF